MATPHRPRASTITSNYLRAIASRDLTAPREVATTLTNALEARDYSACLKNLHGLGIEPQSFIDGLDKVRSRLLSCLAAPIHDLPNVRR